MGVFQCTNDISGKNSWIIHVTSIEEQSDQSDFLIDTFIMQSLIKSPTVAIKPTYDTVAIVALAEHQAHGIFNIGRKHLKVQVPNMAYGWAQKFVVIS